MVTLNDIRAARRHLPQEVIRTGLLHSADLSNKFGCPIYLKPENLQVTGSYKARAAFTILNSLTKKQRRRGAAISSSGNFASAFAFMGRLLDIPVSIVMMRKTAPFKIEKTKRYGGEVVFCDNRFEARWEKLDQLQKERGLAITDHFESADVIAGHGTIGLEILEDLGDVDNILVPISSGGLIAGVAVAAKEMKPSVKVIGVQPEGCNAMYLSLKNGSLQTIPKVDTICDALVSSTPGRLPFEHVQKYVDDIVVVTDDSVRQAMSVVFVHPKLVIEPSGAVGIAALLSGAFTSTGKKTVVLLSGGNVSKENFITALKGREERAQNSVG